MGSKKVVVGAKKHKRLAESIKSRSGGMVRVVERKMEKLQRVVPGGDELHSDHQLLLHTADYILHLRWQVTALEKALLYFETKQRLHS